jgi:hypothetical protein
MKRSIWNCALIAVALAVAGTCIDSPWSVLPAGEMAVSRGGAMNTAKCTQSCLKKNGYSDECANGVGDCHSCTNAATSTNYIDIPTMGCTSGTWKYDATMTINCGNIQEGVCAGMFDCRINNTTDLPCKNAKTVVAQ